MPPTVTSLLIGLVVLAIVFWVLERLSPGRRPQPLWRRDLPTDVGYWFFTPLVTRALSRASVVVLAVTLAAMAGVPLDREHVRAFATRAASAPAALPLWLQAALVLLAGDLVGYGTHRLFHRGALWPFHAVHHSSRQVDWLSSVRLHPVNDVVSRLAQALPILLLGFRPVLIAVYLPFLTFHALLLHANVPWTFGPLRHVLSSPAFHRWHHTTEQEGLDKNFAGLFPFIDVLFGTFYMPPGRQPTAFGILKDDVPAGLWRQLAYPFRRPRPVSS
jgi:sterol desaturase/sphingolipid hydroxylase (fatty acid hydroxylase superfamily)